MNDPRLTCEDHRGTRWEERVVVIDGRELREWWHICGNCDGPITFDATNAKWISYKEDT